LFRLSARTSPASSYCFRFAAKPPLALRNTDNCSTVKLVAGHVTNVTARGHPTLAQKKDRLAAVIPKPDQDFD